jgi:glutathione reductase (NADPH)
MSRRYDFDLFVIGAGSGGVRASRVSAEMGAKVAIAEEDRFGGTCVIRGCVPKKFFVYASAFPEEFEDANGYGWAVGESSFDWPRLIANKDAQIARLEGLYRRAVERPGGTVFEDRAIIKDPHTIHLARSGKDVTAETILVATGARPSRGISVPGSELCIVSDDVFALKTFPQSIVIAGGGYIALEFAHIFHGLGAEVTLVYRGPKVLRGFDDDIRDALQETMRKKGIRLVLNSGFERIENVDGRLRVAITDGETRTADQVMLAIGRTPNTHGLGLQEAGVRLTSRGHIVVDKYSRSTVDNIYAVGDVTGRLELTPVAIHEAMCFARTLYGGIPTAPDHEMVATGVFTRPEIGVAGYSEAKALALGHTIDIYKTTFLPLKHTLSGRHERMLMKLVVDAKTDKVLGCHIFGPEAGEMAQLVAIALKMGATKAQFDATVAVHPTMSEELVTMRAKTATKTPPEIVP